jgi:hypothetical protein
MTCAATQRSVARKTKSVGFVFARSVRAARCQRDSTTRGIKSVRRDEAAFMTQPQKRRLTQLQVKPVRQCAQRGVVGLEVTQASPLFSDHAPREVHLWQ